LKVAIFGAGRVGSTLAYTLAAAAAAREIVLIDAERAKAEGEAMDIAHAVPFFAPVRVRTGEIGDAAGAAVTVIAAGAAQRPGETRPQLAQRNVDMLRNVLPGLLEANPRGLLLVATNPVDTMTYAAARLSRLPSGRVFGSGTVLDTARLRSELSRHYGVDARNVHAYVLGEHGDSELVAWSAASLGGMPMQGSHLASIAARVRDAAYEIIRRKGATNFAIAAALTRIIEALGRDQSSVLTVSTLLDGPYGLRDVCLSLPAVIDAGGVHRVLELPLSADERAALRRSAQAVREALAHAGLAPREALAPSP